MSDSRELRVDLVVDGAKEGAADLDEFADAAKRAEDVEDVEVAVDVDADGAAGELADVEADVKAIDGLKAEARVSVDVDERGIARAKSGLDEIGNEVGPLRDVSGALGGVGVASLDAAEGVTGLGQSLEQMGGKAGAVGAALGKIGFVGAIAATAAAVLKKGLDLLADAANNASGATETLANAQRDLALATSQVKTDEVVRGLVGAKEAQEDWTDSLAKNIPFVGRITKAQKDYVEGLDSSAEAQGVFDDALKRSSSDAAQVLDALKRSRGEYDLNADAIAGMESAITDKLVAEVVASKAADEHKKNVEAVTKAVEAGIDPMGKSLDQIKAEVAAQLLRESVSHGAAQGIADDQQRIADAMTAAGDTAFTAYGESEEAAASFREEIDLLNQALDEQSGAVLGQAEARVRLADAQARYTDAVKSGKSTVDEQIVAAQNVAEAFAAVLDVTARANGQTFTTEERQAAIRTSLQETANKASGPTKTALEDLIRAMDAVPGTIHTDVDVQGTAAALAEINRLHREMSILDNTTAVLKFKVQNPGVPLYPLGAGPSSQAAPAATRTAAPAPVLNVTVNAALGTDAFGLARVVVDAARQAARLNAGARRGTP